MRLPSCAFAALVTGIRIGLVCLAILIHGSLFSFIARSNIVQDALHALVVVRYVEMALYDSQRAVLPDADGELAAPRVSAGDLDIVVAKVAVEAFLKVNTVRTVPVTKEGEKVALG